MTLGALVALLVGALLGFAGTVVLDARRNRRDVLAAATVIQAEILQIGLLAAGFDSDEPFPYPMEDSAWRSHRDRLAAADLSTDDWITLITLYSMNDLVRKGAASPETCGQVDGETKQGVAILNRLRRRRWWRWLW